MPHDNDTYERDIYMQNIPKIVLTTINLTQKNSRKNGIMNPSPHVHI